MFDVSLYFAEMWDGAKANGVRLFDVNVEGIDVLTKFDIFQVAGFRSAINYTFTVRAVSILY